MANYLKKKVILYKTFHKNITILLILFHASGETYITIYLYCIQYLLSAQTDSTAVADTLNAGKKGFFKRFIEYFEKSNKVDPAKKFDFSIIGGPHYSSDTKLGLGMVASGLYRIDRTDLEMSLPMFPCMGGILPHLEPM